MPGDKVGMRFKLERLGLPLEFVTRTTRDLREVLKIIEHARTGRTHAAWSVDADEIQITASVNGMGAEELQDIITDAYEAFRAGSQEVNEWPPTLAYEAQRIIRRILGRVQRTAVASIEVDDHAPLLIGPKTKVKSESSLTDLPEQLSAWSSVDGRLDVISVRRLPYFVIFEHATEHRVHCSFPDEFLPQVKDYLGFRVLAEGFVRYRHDGTPAELTKPVSLERVPDPDEPDMTVYRGSMPGITNSLSSYEYIRRMRDEE